MGVVDRFIKEARHLLRSLAHLFPAPVRSLGRRIGQTIWNACTIYSEIDGEQRAASFAYYVLFSLFPFFALMLTVGSLFVSSQAVTETINSFLPLSDSSRIVIWKMVEKLELARGGVSLISVIILLWCSLRFFLALIRGVNRAWHTVEIPWWQLPLKNLLMIAIIGSALIAGILAPAILQGVRNAVASLAQIVLQHFPQFNLHLFSLVLDLSRYAVGWAVLFYSFSMLYMLAPRRPVRFRQVWIAALAVTIAMQASQIAFINYLPRFVNYGIYGAVGGLMFLLFWVYISGIIVIFGGCLCAAIDKVWNRSRTLHKEDEGRSALL